MSITIEAFEDWGAATGSPAKGTTRTQITNANLLAYSDPAQNYYLNDVPRPIGVTMADDIQICSFKRYISFKIHGTYVSFKNLKITLPGPSTIGNWRVMGKMTNSYAQPTGTLNTTFNRVLGDYDGTLDTIIGSTVLYPRFSTTGPEAATDRPILAAANTTYWTEWLCLQYMGHPSTFDDVGNFGLDTITVSLQELGG